MLERETVQGLAGHVGVPIGKGDAPSLHVERAGRIGHGGLALPNHETFGKACSVTTLFGSICLLSFYHDDF